jgi:hypothetical protein
VAVVFCKCIQNNNYNQAIKILSAKKGFFYKSNSFGPPLSVNRSSIEIKFCWSQKDRLILV